MNERCRFIERFILLYIYHLFFFLFLGNILSPVCNIKVINLILLLSLRISDNYGNKFVKDFRNKKKKIRHEIE